MTTPAKKTPAKKAAAKKAAPVKKAAAKRPEPVLPEPKTVVAPGRRADDPPIVEVPAHSTIEGSRTKTVSTAQGLTEALIENTAALNAVKRRYRGVSFVAAVALLGMFLSFYVRYDSRISSCDRDNELRGGLLRIAATLEIILDDPSPAELAFVGQLRDDFALRDCSAIGYIF